MLTAAQQGTLIVVALDTLPFLGDYLNQDMFGSDGCCPDCCAQCGLVRDIERSGTLDAIVAQAPFDLGVRRRAWWRNGSVDRVWLYAVWDCQSRPNCHTDEVEETYDLDHVAERLARQRNLTVPEAYQLLEERLRYEEALTGDATQRRENPEPVEL